MSWIIKKNDTTFRYSLFKQLPRLNPKTELNIYIYFLLYFCFFFLLLLIYSFVSVLEKLVTNTYTLSTLYIPGVYNLSIVDRNDFIADYVLCNLFNLIIIQGVSTLSKRHLIHFEESEN